ncbi:hypothetical protein NQ318_015331 [Aromia moschata]|uniref:Uncharacterized protein n=1 Tax=Aromia moschata TaxID=1265417 RepID=A0AAV8X9P8_9CUCU|nr:hypothetical protein NQ318_015331 [Aromia moschata]
MYLDHMLCSTCATPRGARGNDGFEAEEALKLFDISASAASAASTATASAAHKKLDVFHETPNYHTFLDARFANQVGIFRRRLKLFQAVLIFSGKMPTWLAKERYPELQPISQSTVNKIKKQFRQRGRVRQLKKNPPNKLSDDQKLDEMLMLEENPHKCICTYKGQFYYPASEYTGMCLNYGKSILTSSAPRKFPFKPPTNPLNQPKNFNVRKTGTPSHLQIFSIKLLIDLLKEQRRVSLEMYFRDGSKIYGNWVYSMRAAYEIHFDHFSWSVKRFLHLYRQTGSVNRKQGSGRSKVRTEEDVEMVRQAITDNPRISITHLSQQVNLLYTTCQRILKDDLVIHPYRLQPKKFLKRTNL